MNKYIYLISFCALLITGCSEDMISSENTSNNAIPVRTEEVERTTFKNTMELVGKTVPSKQIPITSPVPSQVKTIHVKEGQAVQSGDLLFSLDDEAIRQQLSQARSAVVTLEQTRNRLTTTIEQQNATQSRVQSVIDETIDELEGITLPEQVETDIDIGNFIETLNQLKGLADTGTPLSSSLPLINNQLEQARNGVREAERALQATKVKAPINGTMTKINTRAGSPAIPTAPLGIVSSKKDLKALFPANKFQIKDLTEDMRVKMTFSNSTDTFDSKIDSIASQPDSNTNTYAVSVPINDGVGNIPSDVIVTALIETSVKLNVLTIPNEAILYDENDPYVFIVRNDEAVKQGIQLVEEGQQASHVGKGLKEGDLVITEGKYQLTNRSKISMKK